MRVFVTGASGFIGAAVVKDLLQNGHQVLGLARSDASAASLAAAGVDVYRGNLDDPEGLRNGAAQSDGVIHLAFDHESAFSGGVGGFVDVCEKDRHVIEALGSALLGSDRPLLITSGTAMGLAAPGQPATEDYFDLNHPNPRKASEEAGASLTERGVNVSVVRLPQVHDPVKQGLVTFLIQYARDKKVSAYVGEGRNVWPAAHVNDVARLYRLALERKQPGSRYNAVDEEGVPARAIAEAIGKGLNVPVISISPEEASAHFGWLALFVAADMPASNKITRELLNWTPTGPGLIADLEQMQF